jgi:hypothetical protein
MRATFMLHCKRKLSSVHRNRNVQKASSVLEAFRNEAGNIKLMCGSHRDMWCQNGKNFTHRTKREHHQLIFRTINGNNEVGSVGNH